MPSLYRVQTSITGTVVSGGGVNQLHFLAAAGDPQDAVNAAINYWEDLSGIMSGSLTMFTQPDVAVIDVATGHTTSVETVSGGGHSGGSGGEALPPATQGLIRLRTGSYTSGREIRGRTFVPGMTENYSNVGPSETALTTMQTALTNLIAAADAELHVYSYTHHLSAIVTGGSPWNKWAVLRSRRD